MSVPPCFRTTLSVRYLRRKKGGPRGAYLSKPAAHIIPSDAHDVAPLKRPPAGVIARPITQERTVAKAQVIDKCGIAYLDVERRREFGWCISKTGLLRVCVPADQAFVSFSDDPSLASSVGVCGFFLKRPVLHPPLSWER